MGGQAGTGSGFRAWRFGATIHADVAVVLRKALVQAGEGRGGNEELVWHRVHLQHMVLRCTRAMCMHGGEGGGGQKSHAHVKFWRGCGYN